MQYDAAPDGERFAIIRDEDVFLQEPPSLQLFVNWPTALRDTTRGSDSGGPP